MGAEFLFHHDERAAEVLAAEGVFKAGKITASEELEPLDELEDFLELLVGEEAFWNRSFQLGEQALFLSAQGRDHDDNQAAAGQDEDEEKVGRHG